MKNELIKLADHLDKKGLHEEANYLDALLKRAEALDKTAQALDTPQESLKRIEDKLGLLAPIYDACVRIEKLQKTLLNW